MPAAGVYFVLPERIAASAAWQIWSGVGKSGSPTERSTTFMPAAAIAEARAAMASVADGSSARMRWANCRLLDCRLWEDSLVFMRPCKGSFLSMTVCVMRGAWQE